MVQIREGETQRDVTVAEAFVLLIKKRGLEGDVFFSKLCQEGLKLRRQSEEEKYSVNGIVIRPIAPGSPNGALLSLRMATKLDALRDTARIALEPWLVQPALARLGDKRYTPEEQATIVKATRTPSKVEWPDWWEVS